MRIRLGLLAWTGLIVLAVVPWGNLQNHTHWNVVQWVPFVSPPQRARDWVGNTLMYVPVGYLVMRALSDRRRIWRALAFATLLSFSTEVSQLYSHRRFPSTTDLVCNMAGAYIGVRLALRGERRRALAVART